MTTDDIYRSVMMAEPPDTASPFEADDREHLFGGIWSRPGLSIRDRRIITLVCVSDAVDNDAMNAHVYAALASGDLTIDQMTEFVLHFAVYCGWPRASDLEMTVRAQWHRVHEARGDATPEYRDLSIDDLGTADPEQRIEEGRALFEEVNLMGTVSSDSPYFYAGILNFVFGHVWARPGISRRDRRLITLPAVAVCDAFGPIWSHVSSALQSGDLTYDEVRELVVQVGAYAGRPRAQKLLDVADQWQAQQA